MTGVTTFHIHFHITKGLYPIINSMFSYNLSTPVKKDQWNVLHAYLEVSEQKGIIVHVNKESGKRMSTEYLAPCIRKTVEINGELHIGLYPMVWSARIYFLMAKCYWQLKFQVDIIIINWGSDIGTVSTPITLLSCGVMVVCLTYHISIQ